MPDDDQMFETPTQSTEYPGALAFMMGNGIAGSFDFSVLQPGQPYAGTVLRGKPLTANPSYETVTFFIGKDKLAAKDPGVIERVLLLDAQGNTNRFDFEGATQPDTIAPAEFTFTPFLRARTSRAGSSPCCPTSSRPGARRGSSTTIRTSSPSTSPPSSRRTRPSPSARRRLLAARRLPGGRAARRPYLGIHQRLDRDTLGRARLHAPEGGEPLARRAVRGAHGEEDLRRRRARPLRGPRRGVAPPPHRRPARTAPCARCPPKAREGAGGDHAATACSNRRGARALVELSPETGRTHQIRVQLAAAGAPIAGDPLYGGAPGAAADPPRRRARAAPPRDRQAAHASARPLPPSFARWVDGGGRGPPERRGRARGAASARAADRRYGVAHAPGARTALPPRERRGRRPARRRRRPLRRSPRGRALRRRGRSAAREAVLDAAAALGAAGVYLKVRPRHASVVVDTRREDVAPRGPVRGAPAPEAITVATSSACPSGCASATASPPASSSTSARTAAACASSRAARGCATSSRTRAPSPSPPWPAARAPRSPSTSLPAPSPGPGENLDAVGADPAHHALRRGRRAPLARARRPPRSSPSTSSSSTRRASPPPSRAASAPTATTARLAALALARARPGRPAARLHQPPRHRPRQAPPLPPRGRA